MPKKMSYLSVNKTGTAVASCSLATIYQCYNDLGIKLHVTSLWLGYG